jgi:hypothetical protein
VYTKPRHETIAWRVVVGFGGLWVTDVYAATQRCMHMYRDFGVCFHGEREKREWVRRL